MFESQKKRATAVRRSIDLGAPSAEVWKVITDDALLSDWLAEDVEIDPRPGGSLSCLAEDGERTGVVELAEEEQRLVFTWAGGEATSRVEIDLQPLPAGTRLTVRETRLEGGGAASASAWSARLESLRRCLASLAYA
jgi:uncharacterized protein YndB with AHSA1/START domain